MFRRSCPVPTAPRPPWPARVRAAAIAPIGRYLSRQASAPYGAFGHVLGKIWVNESAAVNDVAIELLAPTPGERICEIGFGPGRTLARLAEIGAEAIGVEVSPVMIATATRRNPAAMTAGCVSLHRGDGTHLPLPDNSLDAVIAVHTIYFWPNLAATLADTARTLRTGGRLVLALQPGEHPLSARFDPAIYHPPTTTDLAGLLHTAGFANVRVERRQQTAPAVVWLVATAP